MMSERLYDAPKRSGGEKRGNSADRRRRKEWMVSPEAGFGGDNTEVPCVHCGNWTSGRELHADRMVPGGSYKRDNIQPACANCNQERSDKADYLAPQQFRMA